MPRLQIPEIGVRLQTKGFQVGSGRIAPAGSAIAALL